MTLLPSLLHHHAYLLSGSVSTKSQLLEELNSAHNIPAHANPDLFDRSYISFTIDDAREVKAFHDTKPIGKTGKKVFVVYMQGITVEAQNALLKLLEEPGEYATFFLIVPSLHILLPTVKSRLQILEKGKDAKDAKKREASEKKTVEKTVEEYEEEYGTEIWGDAGKFQKANAAKRLEMVKVLVDEISKEKKTRLDAINFLNAVEAVVYSEKGIKDKDTRSLIEAIQLARKYINDRSPSLKMLLEYVSLS